MPLEAKTGDYSKLVVELVGMITIDPQFGEIEQANLTGDWQLIGEVRPNKLTALNRSAGIFVKFFPPQTKDYAEKYQQTLQQLAGIENLPSPILLPEALSNGGLVFKAGEPLGKIKFEDLDVRVREEMTRIVSDNGLESLSRFDKLDVVRVGGKDFLVDLIEDSFNSIEQFVEGE